MICFSNTAKAHRFVNNLHFVYGSLEYHDLVLNIYSIWRDFRMMYEHISGRDGDASSLCENNK